MSNMSYSDVEIKTCRDEFMTQLTKLWKEYIVDQGEDPLRQYFDFDASTEGFRKILEGYMKREPGGFLVAAIGDEVVGFTVSFKDAFGPNYVTNRKFGEIQVVHVKQGFRRRGIATSLIDAALSYLKASGCSIVLAETGEKNTKSVKMLEKIGFKRRGELISFMKDI